MFLQSIRFIPIVLLLAFLLKKEVDFKQKRL